MHDIVDGKLFFNKISKLNKIKIDSSYQDK